MEKTVRRRRCEVERNLAGEKLERLGAEFGMIRSGSGGSPSSNSEPSSLKQGSYERPRYAAARYRVAELYRDRIGDKPRAVREFRRVWDEHPTSLLKDDALWQAARLEHDRGEAGAACKLMKVLVSEAPDSRFAACASALCPSVRPAQGECHAYVLRELGPSKDE